MFPPVHCDPSCTHLAIILYHLMLLLSSHCVLSHVNPAHFSAGISSKAVGAAFGARQAALVLQMQPAP
jgi:hypothetical protein